MSFYKWLLCLDPHHSSTIIHRQGLLLEVKHAINCLSRLNANTWHCLQVAASQRSSQKHQSRYNLDLFISMVHRRSDSNMQKNTGHSSSTAKPCQNTGGEFVVQDHPRLFWTQEKYSKITVPPPYNIKCHGAGKSLPQVYLSIWMGPAKLDPIPHDFHTQKCKK